MEDWQPSRNEGHPDKICDQVSDAAPRSMMTCVCSAVPAARTATTATAASSRSALLLLSSA